MAPLWKYVCRYIHVYLVVVIIDSREGALLALGPSLNWEVSLGHSDPCHALRCTRLRILHHYRDQRAGDEWGGEGEGEECGGDGREEETVFVCHTARHVCVIDENLRGREDGLS